MPNKVVCRKYRRKCASDIGELLSNIERLIFFNIFPSPELLMKWRWHAKLALWNFAQRVRSAEARLEVSRFGRSLDEVRKSRSSPFPPCLFDTELHLDTGNLPLFWFDRAKNFTTYSLNYSSKVLWLFLFSIFPSGFIGFLVSYTRISREPFRIFV